MKIGVLGAGTWGTALSRMLSISGHDVTIWSALPDEIEEMQRTHLHKNLPGMVIPEEVRLTTSIEDAACGKDILLFEGVDTWFDRMDRYAESKGIELEHYIISSGLKEIIEGSSISPHIKRIYASSYLYNAD